VLKITERWRAGKDSRERTNCLYTGRRGALSPDRARQAREFLMQCDAAGRITD
jgi:hypothetical protein